MLRSGCLCQCLKPCLSRSWFRKDVPKNQPSRPPTGRAPVKKNLWRAWASGLRPALLLPHWQWHLQWPLGQVRHVQHKEPHCSCMQLALSQELYMLYMSPEPKEGSPNRLPKLWPALASCHSANSVSWLVPASHILQSASLVRDTSSIGSWTSGEPWLRLSLPESLRAKGRKQNWACRNDKVEWMDHWLTHQMIGYLIDDDYLLYVCPFHLQATPPLPHPVSDLLFPSSLSDFVKWISCQEEGQTCIRQET